MLEFDERMEMPARQFDVAQQSERSCVGSRGYEEGGWKMGTIQSAGVQRSTMVTFRIRLLDEEVRKNDNGGPTSLLPETTGVVVRVSQREALKLHEFRSEAERRVPSAAIMGQSPGRSI